MAEAILLVSYNAALLFRSTEFAVFFPLTHAITTFGHADRAAPKLANVMVTWYAAF